MYKEDRYEGSYDKAFREVPEGNKIKSFTYGIAGGLGGFIFGTLRAPVHAVGAAVNLENPIKAMKQSIGDGLWSGCEKGVCSANDVNRKFSELGQYRGLYGPPQIFPEDEPKKEPEEKPEGGCYIFLDKLPKNHDFDTNKTKQTSKDSDWKKDTEKLISEEIKKCSSEKVKGKLDKCAVEMLKHANMDESLLKGKSKEELLDMTKSLAKRMINETHGVVCEDVFQKLFLDTEFMKLYLETPRKSPIEEVLKDIKSILPKHEHGLIDGAVERFSSDPVKA